MDRMKIAQGKRRRCAEEQKKRGLEWEIAWQSSASSLERAADIIWKEVKKDQEAMRKDEEPESDTSVSCQFMLLAGLAIENYLKAICIKRHGAYSLKGDFQFGHHDFVKLATQSGLAFNSADGEFIERLEHFVIFAGRYPAPKNSDALLPRIQNDGSWGTLSYVRSTDYADWKTLLQTLRATLET
jgi:hypothetical protein